VGHHEPHYCGPKIVNLLQPGELFSLTSGQKLPHLHVQYETYGTMNEARDNVILLLHGFTANAHAHSTETCREPGWWEWMIGENNVLDTTRFCILSSNVLGGCGGTTGPEDVNPVSGTPWYNQFPEVTISDIVAVQQLLLTYLGCNQLYAVVGGSMGGMQAIEWMVQAPEKVERVCVLAAAARLPEHSRLFSAVARQSITGDMMTQSPHRGYSLARLIALLTYRPLAEAPAAISWADSASIYEELRQEANSFSHRFSPYTYTLLSRAMERYDRINYFRTNPAPPKGSSPRCTLVSFSSDWLFPPSHVAHLAEILSADEREVHYHCVETSRGHDAFLYENTAQTHILREALQ